MQAAVTSATGSEKKAASAVKTAGRRSRQLKKISLRNAETEQCELHLPKRSRLIHERILDGKRDDHLPSKDLIYRTERIRISGSLVKSDT